jgi:hypothetical protein
MSMWCGPPGSPGRVFILLMNKNFFFTSPLQLFNNCNVTHRLSIWRGDGVFSNKKS